MNSIEQNIAFKVANRLHQKAIADQLPPSVGVKLLIVLQCKSSFNVVIYVL